MASPVVHWEIGARAAQKLSEFYASLFDWTINTENPEYGLVSPADGGIGGGIMQVPDGVPPTVTIYIHVDDIEATLKKTADLGGAVVRPPEPIPGVGQFALFRDPEGNVIGLLAD